MPLAEALTIKGHYKQFSLSRDLTPIEILRLRLFCRGQGPRPSLPVIASDDRHNLITTRGKNVFARRLAGDTTYTGTINYGALGTDDSARSAADTILNAEQFRKLAADSTFDDNVAYIDWFFASGDLADDTYYEFGAFIDGTGTINSGQLFSTLQTTWVKSGSMFVSLQITV